MKKEQVLNCQFSFWYPHFKSQTIRSIILPLPQNVKDYLLDDGTLVVSGRVMGWMRANKLKLNPDKTEVLLVGGSGFGEGELNLVLNGVALPLRDKVRSLGVLLDPELSLEAQVTAVARSAFLQLRLIHQLRPYLENDCLATVTHALVTSRLDFCNALYVGLPLKTVRILQLVQNRAARLLTGTGRYVHMTPVLRQLHWLPIEVRAQFKVLVMTYKALNGLGPGYLKERLHPYVPSRPLRSAGEALLREPSMEEVRRVVTRRRAFSAVAPKEDPPTSHDNDDGNEDEMEEIQWSDDENTTTLTGKDMIQNMFEIFSSSGINTNNKAPEFPEFALKVEEAISSLGGSVFPKLNWSAPRDAYWIAMNSSLKCKCLSDIFLLFKSSDFITCDFTQPGEQKVDLQVLGTSTASMATCQECLKLKSKTSGDLPSAQQILEEMLMHVLPPTPRFIHCNDDSPDPSLEYELVLRKWCELIPGAEFRCFVKENKLIGISQRDYTQYYEHISKQKEEICRCIQEFFQKHIQYKFFNEDFVFDVYRDSMGRVWLIDFNPFGEVTDSLLFTWEELRSGNSLKEDQSEAAAMEQDYPAFRCTNSNLTVQPSPYLSYRLPKDFVDLSTGEDVHKLIDLLKLVSEFCKLRDAEKFISSVHGLYFSIHLIPCFPKNKTGSYIFCSKRRIRAYFQRAAFRKCSQCGSKMSLTDPHLGERHRTDKCGHCQAFTKQARKNCENRLRKMLWDQALMQSDQLAAKPASASATPPPRPSADGALVMQAQQPPSPPHKQKEKRKHGGSEKSSGHKKPKKDKLDKMAHKPRKPNQV
ncbi:hypothetical protein EYD10_07390 [Varanus komodoensis]|nr:hypothetical protein EYD10_07390 [Varanus komodoensis]